MTKKPRSPYGSEEREVVVTLDRRVLYLLAIVAAFALAVGGGYVVSRPHAPAAGNAGPPGATGAADPAVAIDEQSARATAAALGLPGSVVIVTPNVVETVQPQGTALPPGSIRLLDPTEAAKVTPGSTLEIQLMTEQAPQIFDVNPDPNRIKNHEVLSNTVDPNVDTSDHRPLRLETVSKPVNGPRLAISDLNLNYTYDFGVISMTQRAAHSFVAKNVGNEDLVIWRVYTGCGCTALTIGNDTIPPDGILPAPRTIKPGNQIEFAIEYDAKAEGRPGATAKYIQMFTNDPNYLMFDETNPLSHETRFRIVVEPE
jgi:hypothetical protein